MNFSRTVKSVRSAINFWIPKNTVEILHQIRTNELQQVFPYIPGNSKILDIGAGTGWQSNLLESQQHHVSSLDIPSSHYKDRRVRHIIEYDGKTIPFPDNSFDVIFTSNVLEHVLELDSFLLENMRVLKPEGVCIHIVPSAIWRIYTNFTHPIKAWTLPKPHGEHANSAWGEIVRFKKKYWSELFIRNGWLIIHIGQNNLFYTGSFLFGLNLPIKARLFLSRLLGSSCHILVIRKQMSIPILIQGEH